MPRADVSGILPTATIRKCVANQTTGAPWGRLTEVKRGREFAAWLGIIPKQCSTGGKTKILGISFGSSGLRLRGWQLLAVTTLYC